MEMRVDAEIEGTGAERDAFVMHHVDPGLAGIDAVEPEIGHRPALVLLTLHGLVLSSASARRCR
ncbi:hypothetical protein D3C76_1788660 [compost metagenome]